MARCPSTVSPIRGSTARPSATTGPGPSYPPDCVAWFAEHLGIAPGRRVLDLAAGHRQVHAPARAARRRPRGRRTRRRDAGDPPRAQPRRPGAVVHGGAAAVRRRIARRDHRRPGVPLVRRPGRARGGGAGPAHRRPARAGVERAGPHAGRTSTRCGRSWTASRRRRRGASTRSGARPRSPRPPFFGPMHEATFHHEQLMTVEEVVDRFRSVSHVAVLATRRADGGARRGAGDAGRRIPTPPGGTTIAIPYRVDAYWCEKA